MKNLKLSTRLVISFAIIISLSLIIVALAFIQVEKMSSNVKIIYEHPFMVSNSIKEIEIYVNAMRSSMKDVVLSDDIEELNKNVAIVNNYNRLVQQSYKIVEERYLGPKNDVIDAHNTYNDWHKIRDKIIALKKAGKSNEAIKIVKEEGAANVKLIHDKNFVILKFAKNKAAEINANHFKEFRKSTLLLEAIVFLLLLLTIVFIFIIFFILNNQKIRLKAEEALVEKTIQLNFALETSQAGAWNLDLEDGTATRTLLHDQIFGYKTLLPEWTFNDFMKHVFPEDRSLVQSSFNKAIETKGSWRLECRIIRFDGEIRWIKAVGSHVQNKLTNHLSMTGVVQDITEYKMAIENLKTISEKQAITNKELVFQNKEKEKLVAKLDIADKERRKANEYLENLFRYANAPIIVWDTQLNITRFNPAFEALTGRKAIDVIGMSIEILFPPDQRKESLKIIKELDKEKRMETVEIDIAHINGTRKTVLWNSAAIKDVDGNKIIATIAQGQDITVRKQIAENLNITLDSLENSNKELEQFAYIASHDLQEPLRMISSYTQLLERRYKDKLDDEANEFIHFAVDGANRMQMMINDLLEYSRISTRGKELKEIAVSITLEKVISILQLKIDDSSTIITNDTLPLVKGDESQLFRVFQNLIENAIKFKKKSENPKIHISCQKKNEFYEFSVKDNGIGMDMKYKDKLFIIFSRLHSSKEYPGTGMGLSICKRIIERHGGKIWFDSKVNEGTTFYFTLPV
jgi:PAS domain S-box-containing protein